MEGDYDVKVRKKNNQGMGCLIIILIILFLMIMGNDKGNPSSHPAPTLDLNLRSVTPKTALVTARRAALRSKPGGESEGSTILKEVGKGERLDLLSPDFVGKGWYHVRHPGTKQEGWVHGNLIKLE